MKRFLLGVVVVALGWFANLAAAQGVVLPVEPRDRVAPVRPMAGSFVMKSIAVDAVIKNQVAQLQLTQVIRNPSSAQIEATYLFPIPHDGAIDSFTLLVDGKEFPAKMYKKEEARKIYEEIVRSRRDPALLEYMGYDVLQTSVFPVPAGAERTLVLKYSQVCRRDQFVNEFFFPLSTAKLSGQPIGQLSFDLRLDSGTPIKSIYSPTHADLDVKRTDDHHATIRLSQSNVSAADDLRLFWATSEKTLGVTLLSVKPTENEDGYFLLLASPEVQAVAQPVAKTVVFVLDKSGSMQGRKIEQARNGLKFVLNNLRDGDMFNIVAFDDKIEAFKPELLRFDESTRKEAIAFADNVREGGSTNIDGALKRAVDLVGDAGDRPAYIIFLTDGLPTAGETRELAIAENMRKVNKARVKVFLFGVGYDVNARLIDRLATENFGSSDYVKPNEDIEASVARFYSKMTAPVLTNIAITFDGSVINRAYPTPIPDMFSGGQLLWTGRYAKSGKVSIKITGKVGAAEKTIDLEGNLASTTSNDDTYGFVEKLWAVRRVGDIINELDLKGKNKELIDELVQLSVKHGILTPYTAFLADERTTVTMDSNRLKEWSQSINTQGVVVAESGKDAVNVRASKGAMQRAAQAPAAGAQRYTDVKGDTKVASNLQMVRNQAMYQRNNRWADPSVTEDEAKKAEQVEQFSEKFFELARANPKLRPFLALPEGCVVRANGKVFQINPPVTQQQQQQQPGKG